MAETRPLKPHASYRQQLDRLRERGLQVGDEHAALVALERLGYYRLSGYFYPMRATRPPGQSGRHDRFQPGASFELVHALAEFDKRLRLLCLYAVESVELAVRVAIAHHLGRFDPEAHLHQRLLDGRFVQPGPHGEPSAHERWLVRYRRMLADSREDFVLHHVHVYGGRLPIWVAVELWDFGMLSRFFAGMEYRDRQRLAMQFGAVSGEVMRSWLRAFNFVRNVAAHHARLWNRRSPDIPVLPPVDRCRWLASLHDHPDATSKMFGLLSCLLVMMRSIQPGSEWPDQLTAHWRTFPSSPLVTVAAAGFPPDWSTLPLWGDG